MEKYDKGKLCACRPCRCTKFVPITTPRYNKDGVDTHVWMSDLKLFNEHRKRCFYVQSKIDTKPPRIDMAMKIKPLILYKDAHRAMLIDKENKDFMMRLIELDRVGGLIDSVNSLANFHMSNWKGRKGNMLRIERENKIIHKKIAEAKSHYTYSPKEWKYFVNSLKKSAHYPLVVFKKKGLDEEIRSQPSISTGFPKITDHVECFMDFTVHNGEYLGRIILELYQDVAPLPVQNFLDFCESYSQTSSKNPIIIQRIVKDRYFESSIITSCEAERQRRKNTISSVGKRNKLKHSRGGTISMMRDEKSMNNLKLFLTFCPMPQLDRKNEVFGKVTKGMEVLMKINGYSRKIGKPLDTIILADCGEMPPCICHKKMVKCKPH